MNDNYRVAVIDSMSEWQTLAVPWNVLLQASSSNTVFLTHQWLFSWAECFLNRGRKLFILAVYEKNDLVGVAPFYIHSLPFGIFSLKQIQLLGLPEAGSDYLDVVARRGKEKQVALRIFDFLFNEASRSWDCLMLRDIPSNSLFLLHFSEKIHETGKYAETTLGSFCPAVRLPDTEEEYFSSLSANRRALFRRHLRVLETGSQLEHTTCRAAPTESEWEDFVSFCRANKTHDMEEVLSFLRAYTLNGGENGRVQIDTLSVDGKDLARLLHLRHGNGLYMYLMATDKTFNPKVSVGNVLVGLCISDAIRKGKDCYDFLKGAEDYKFSWSGGGNSSLRYFLCRRGVIPWVFMVTRFLKYSVKMMLR